MNTVSWRDRQISAFNHDPKKITILQQEKVMLDFMDSCGQISWKWLGDSNSLADFCHANYNITNKMPQGVVIFGKIFYNKTTSYICQTIKKYMSNVDYVYCAINRYEIARHDLDFDLPDSIEDSLDCIVRHCHPGFKRLFRFPEVDGNHMVASHPLDCFGLCK